MTWIDHTRLLASLNVAICLLGVAVALWGWWV